MTHCKKVLSIVLCLAMLLGTLTTGLMFASAAEDTAIPSYASLQSKYTSNFFYVGTEFYEGENLTNHIVSPGSSLNVKLYAKTDYPLYGGQYFIVIDNKNAVETLDRIRDEAGAFADGMTALKAFSGSAVKFYTLKNGVATVNIAGGYTQEDIDNWYIVGIYDTKNATTARACATNDAPLTEFNLKLKSDFEGSFNVFFVPESITPLNGGVAVTTGYQAINDSAARGTAAKPAVKADNCEIQAQQSFTVSKLAVFKDLDGSVIDEQALETGDKPNAPSVSNLYGWADGNGDIVNPEEIAMESNSMVYTAIPNSYEVDVTLLGNGGMVDGQESKTVKLKIGDGFDPSKYTATRTGKTFYGWGIGKKIEEVYKFTSINPVDAQALWDENLLTVYIPTNYRYETDEDTGIEVKLPGKVVPLCHVVGLTGEKLTVERGNEITELAKATLLEKGDEITGFGFDVTFNALTSVRIISLSYNENGQAVDASGNINVDNGYTLAAINNAVGLMANPVIFGKTTGLLMQISITKNVSFHYPAFDADGNWDGESWIDYRLKKAGSADATPTDAATGTEPAEDQYEDFNVTYTTIFDFSDLDGENIDFDKIKAGFYNGASPQGSPQYEGGSYDPEAGFVVAVSRLKTIENDPNPDLKYHYYNTFVDGQGNKLSITDDKKVDIKPDNCSKDEEGILRKNLFDVYTYPVEREYNIAFNAVKSADDDSINKYVVAKNFKYGAEITEADFAELYAAEIGGEKITAAELKKDGLKVALGGYYLNEIIFKAEGLDETNFTKGGVLTLDGALIDHLNSIQAGFTDLRGVSVITFTGIFEPRSFDFVIKYTNAEGKVVELTKLTFKGNETFKFSEVMTAELLKKVNDDCQVGRRVATNGFADKDGKDVYDIKAFEGPYELFIKYESDERVAFVDYANAKDDGYVMYKVPYGTRMYREDYDPDKTGTEYGPNEYRFNQYLVSGDSKFSSKPMKEQKTDDDGNPMYEPKLVEATDTDGNVVIDDITGEPKMVPAKDKDGKTIYDETKPVYKDPKGETVQRPYRNCEFMGTKAYHLDHPVYSWADVPAQSEWIEGYENEACEIYTTDILQLQWKPDSDFLLRVYNTDNVGLQLSISPFSISMGMNGNIYSALGRDFRWYYWDNEGRPCKKGEGMLNTKPDEQIIILLWPKVEKIPASDLKVTTQTDADSAGEKTVSSWYLTAIPLGRDFFKPSLIPTLLPTILKAVRGLIN